jgi:hypothetical protein
MVGYAGLEFATILEAVTTGARCGGLARKPEQGVVRVWASVYLAGAMEKPYDRRS